MAEIFDALPGIEAPVGDISRGLAELWAGAAASGGPAPSAEDAKATQANLVLHLGFNTTPADAVEQFQVVARFAQSYPSRIVVLCPLADDAGVTDMRAKIYGECYLGKSKSDKRCVEYVMLSYPRAARCFLENQVSICLSTDLPLYYWAHRFSASARLADYRFLLGRAKRVMIDSAIAPADAFSFPWPNPTALRDLVYSRLLPVRQTVGQFLAGYAPDRIIGGLRGVTVGHTPALAAEGRVLLGWLRRRLEACGAEAADVKAGCEPVDTGSLAVRFDFAEAGKYFRWHGDFATKLALFEADFGGGVTKLPAAAGLLTPERALSEAMFM
jgi:glucose-6-phosphate dehydrogenase assembly protein OpcA